MDLHNHVHLPTSPPPAPPSSSSSPPPSLLLSDHKDKQTPETSFPSSSSSSTAFFRPPPLALSPSSPSCSSGVSSAFFPVVLPLSDKQVPSFLSESLHPTALLTNLWSSISLSSKGFSSELMYLIARSLPWSEYSGAPSQPLIIRMKHPSCTAILHPTGKLSIMGGLTPDQALLHAYRLAYKIKFRTQWKFSSHPPGGSPHLSNSPELSPKDLKSRLLFSSGSEAFSSASSLSGSKNPPLKICYEPLDFIRFAPERMRIHQMVCRLDLGKNFRPDLERIECHPSLQGFVIGVKDGITVRIPLAYQKAPAGLEVQLEGNSPEKKPRCRLGGEERVHAFDTMTDVSRTQKKKKLFSSSSSFSQPKKTWVEEEDEEGEDDEEDEDNILAAELFAGGMREEREGEEEEEEEERREGVSPSHLQRQKRQRRKSSSQLRGGLEKEGRTMPSSSFSSSQAENDDFRAKNFLKSRAVSPRKLPRFATCLVYRTGRILVLGCRSVDEIDYAVTFIWPALVGF